MSVMIETRGLTKTFNTGKGCRDISLSVGEGSIFAFLGPNGAGKSTFVKMLVGLTEPTKGEAEVLGFPLGHLEARRRIGYLPELYRYQDWLSGNEVLALHGRLCGMERSAIHSRIPEVVRDVGLEGRSAERVRTYSKGMQQRLGLAAALLARPKLVFLDEPSSALDPIGRYEVKRLLVRLREEGTTIFLNTHLLEDVEEISDEVALLIDGQIRARGTLDSLIRQSFGWEFQVGGYMADMHAAVEQLSGVELQLTAPEREGEAVLMANLENAEQAAWVNALLIDHGFTLYRSAPGRSRLDDWFMRMVADSGREVRT